MGTATAGAMIDALLLEPEDEDWAGCDAATAEPALEVVVISVLEPPESCVMIEVMTETDWVDLLLD